MQDMDEPYENTQAQRHKYDPLDEHARNEQSTRSFFAYLSFFMALILLTVFLNTPLDGLSKMLVLGGVIALALFGVTLLDRRRSLQNRLPSRGNAGNEEEPDDEEFLEENERQDDEVSQQPEASTPFIRLVQEALDSIPAEFHQQMDNLVVLVEDEPDAETLARVGTAEGAILLGLYQGVPLTALGHYHAPIPERITIYQHNIEAYCHYNPTRIREQVRETVLHEVAHHFGMDHDEMPIWIK